MIKLYSIEFPLFAKRLVDIIVASSLLFLTFPLFIIVALAIKCDSPGQVIFRQLRLGKDRRNFTCYKFRSMRLGSNDLLHREYIKELMSRATVRKSEKGKIYKLTDDPRLTAVGKFIRRLSIDELPQLFNVLKGEMSMVGPRPAIPYELQYYDERMFKRFLVKPGVTGLWQISGRSSLGYMEMVDLDIRYIEHWSAWFDLSIILKTIPYVLKISQAY